MPRKSSPRHTKKPIEQYEHKGKKRTNNPPVGLVTPETDPPESAKKTYAYDPHLDPQLVWAGKAERMSFDVPTVSLHVHERIDPRTIIEAARKRNGNGQPAQGMLFDSPAENPPLREAIDFYKHAHNWSNRLISGDSLLVMNSLLEKEGMAGQVQMVYIDPPYGIKYGSNFQPFVNKRDVKDGKDDDLTQEPEMIRAFRDTWELGIHSYLSYLRDRLWLAKELLNESGSCFVQISDVNLHLVRSLMDEVFGPSNLCAVIPFAKTTSTSTVTMPVVCDYLAWYGKDTKKLKYHKLFREMDLAEAVRGEFKFVELPDGTTRQVSKEERLNPGLLPLEAKPFRTNTAVSPERSSTLTVEIDFGGITKYPGEWRHWKTSVEGMQRLHKLGRLVLENSPTRMFKRYFDDFRVIELNNLWTDTRSEQNQIYVVQTVEKVIERSLLMTTDPGDLVFDPTCGSGTTAYVAEQWGRRWITCETSRVATTLAKQRLMTATYDYYELAHSGEGVGSGFKYKTVPHVTLKSIANNEPHATETLYDQPEVDKSKARVSGPFTVEAVPAPTVRSLSELSQERSFGPSDAEATQARLDGTAPAQQGRFVDPPDTSIARSGETLRQSEWRDVLLKGGVRGKGGQKIEFTRVEPLGGTRWLHADAETKGAKPERVVVSFGPEYAPLEQRQVELAWAEARQLSPRPEILLFVYSDIDPEAGKDIAELTPAKTGMTFLAAKIDADVWTKDLKKKARVSPSVWLVGQPDVEVRQVSKGEHKGKWEVEVCGFDYFNTKTGTIESGDTSRIAMWLLDTDYDGRSLYPRQVFFPMANEGDGWARLAKNLKAEIDPDLIQAYRGTVSLPFEPGQHKRIAVKIVDDRGIESLKIVEVK